MYIQINLTGSTGGNYQATPSTSVAGPGIVYNGWTGFACNFTAYLPQPDVTPILS